jgi:hypothetical protein
MVENKLRRAIVRRPQEAQMSRAGAGYFGLLAALRQEELLSEAMRRQRATDVIRRRRGQTLTSRIRRALRVSKR